MFKLGNLSENPLFKIAYLNDQNTLEISGCHMSRLPFRAVGSHKKWISEGLSCVRFPFKLAT